MKDSNDSKPSIHRRDLIKGVAAASLGLASGVLGIPKSFGQSAARSASSGQSGRNLVLIENAKPGTRDWMLTKTDITENEPVELWRSPRIEGYCSETSVSAGETLKVMVSTNPVSEFSLEIYRTGYYGGTGGRFMKRFDSVQGKTQPDPEIGENRLRECKWEPSVEFEIPDDWLSGVYLGKLTEKKEGVQSYVIFVVRDDRPCDLLFQCSDMTWACYNAWPTNEWSLYHDNVNSYTGYKKRKKMEPRLERYRVGEFRPSLRAVLPGSSRRSAFFGRFGRISSLGISLVLLDRAAGLRCVVYFEFGYAHQRAGTAAYERIHLRGP